MIKIEDKTLDTSAIIHSVEDKAAGAIDVFIGTVREQTQGKTVLRLEFEAYATMAIAEMEKIAQQAKAQWPVKKMAIHHRIGTLEVGEVAVIIAVSTPHRAASFAACRYVIDTLKQTVPIWKKEVFGDGEVWVAAHP